MTTRALVAKYLLTAAVVLAVGAPGAVVLWSQWGWLAGAVALVGVANAADWLARRVVWDAEN